MQLVEDLETTAAVEPYRTLVLREGFELQGLDPGGLRTFDPAIQERLGHTAAAYRWDCPHRGQAPPRSTSAVGNERKRNLRAVGHRNAAQRLVHALPTEEVRPAVERQVEGPDEVVGKGLLKRLVQSVR